MSSFQWVIAYVCIAALVAGGAMAVAAWSRENERSMRTITVGPAMLAGAMWPLVVAGLVQWALVLLVAKTLRSEPQRTSQAAYFGPEPAPSRQKVNAA